MEICNTLYQLHMRINVCAEQAVKGTCSTLIKVSFVMLKTTEKQERCGAKSESLTVFSMKLIVLF